MYNVNETMLTVAQSKVSKVVGLKKKGKQTAAEPGALVIVVYC